MCFFPFLPKIAPEASGNVKISSGSKFQCVWSNSGAESSHGDPFREDFVKNHVFVVFSTILFVFLFAQKWLQMLLEASESAPAREIGASGPILGPRSLTATLFVNILVTKLIVFIGFGYVF